MDHALELHREFAQRGRRADRQRLEEVARELHLSKSVVLKQGCPWLPYEEHLRLAKPLLKASALTSARAAPAGCRSSSYRGKCRTILDAVAFVTFGQALLQWNIGLADHLAPELRLLDEELRRLRTGFRDRFHLNSARLFGHVRSSEDFDHIAI